MNISKFPEQYFKTNRNSMLLKSKGSSRGLESVLFQGGGYPQLWDILRKELGKEEQIELYYVVRMNNS